MYVYTGKLKFPLCPCHCTVVFW